MERKHGNPTTKKAETKRYGGRSRLVAATLTATSLLSAVAACGQAIAGQPEAITLHETPSPTTTTTDGAFGRPPQLVDPNMCDPTLQAIYRQSIKNINLQLMDCRRNTTNADALGAADLTFAESATDSDNETAPHLSGLFVQVVYNGADTATNKSAYTYRRLQNTAVDESILAPNGTLFTHCFERQVLAPVGVANGYNSYYMGCLVGKASEANDAFVFLQGMSPIPNDDEAQSDVRALMFDLEASAFINING